MPMLMGIEFEFSAFSDGSITPFMMLGIGITVIAFLAWVGISIYCVKRNGQSIAKRMLGIKVVRSDGDPEAPRRPHELGADEFRKVLLARTQAPAPSPPSQPPRNPARRRPRTICGQRRISRQTKPDL